MSAATTNILIVLVSADKGLAGAFNANVIKATQAFLKENDGKVVEMIPVGRKGRDFFKRRDVEFTEEYIGLTGSGQVVHADAVEIANKIIKTFTEDTTIDKVFIVFTEFKTVLSQKPVIEQLLPIPRTAATATANRPVRRPSIFTNSPPPRSLESLLPKQVETQIYKGMLESVAPNRVRG